MAAAPTKPLPTGYENLSEVGRKIVDMHRGYVKSIYELVNIRDFLIQEIHRKKSEVVDEKCIPQGENILQVYHQVLFLGQQHIGTFSDWTGEFKNVLENLLYIQLSLDGGIVRRNISERFELTQVYYGSNEVEDGVYIYSPIHKPRWTLSDGIGVWTPSDQIVISAYVDKLLTFLTDKRDLLQSNGLNVDDCNAEILKVTTHALPFVQL